MTVNTDILRAPQTQFLRFEADKFYTVFALGQIQANGIRNPTSHAFEERKVTKNIRHMPKQSMQK